MTGKKAAVVSELDKNLVSDKSQLEDTNSQSTDAQSTDAQSTEVQSTPNKDAFTQSSEELLKRLLAAHQAWFDVQENFTYAGHTFAGFAKLDSHGEQYVLVKRAKLWEVDAHELMFFELVDHLDADTLTNLVDFMTSQVIKMVDAKKNHMTTYLSLVIIANSLDFEIAQRVRRIHFRKNFKLGLHGWADLRLAVIDLSGAQVVTNAMGKSLKETLENNAFAQHGNNESKRR